MLRRAAGFIGCPTCDHLSGRRQTDLCGLGKKATLPNYARSVNRNATRFSELDIYQHNPWSAPVSAHSFSALRLAFPRGLTDPLRHQGSAPVADACGLAGGSPWDWNRAEAGNYVNTSKARHGQLGTTLPEMPTATIFKIGGEAEVSWQVRNNHGGGAHLRIFLPAPPLHDHVQFALVHRLSCSALRAQDTSTGFAPPPKS